MSRGIIAAAGIINPNENGFTLERSLSSQEIRYYALYWDKVVIPANNLVYIGLPEEEILIDSGVMVRPKVGFQGSFSGSEVGNTFALSQAVVAEKLMKEERDTDWVLHQIGNQLNIPNEFEVLKNTLRFDLINVLPVPSGDVPIADIIEFKNRREDALNELHQSIESVYIEALKCPDLLLGSSIAIRELKASIQNLDRYSSEKWKRTSKFDFSVSLNLDGGDIAKGVATGSAFDFFSGGCSLPVALIGGIASIFKFKAGYTASFKPASNNINLAFLSHAHKEKILEHNRY